MVSRQEAGARRQTAFATRGRSELVLLGRRARTGTPTDSRHPSTSVKTAARAHTGKQLSHSAISGNCTSTKPIKSTRLPESKRASWRKRWKDLTQKEGTMTGRHPGLGAQQTGASRLTRTHAGHHPHQPVCPGGCDLGTDKREQALGPGQASCVRSLGRKRSLVVQPHRPGAPPTRGPRSDGRGAAALAGMSPSSTRATAGGRETDQSIWRFFSFISFKTLF